MLVRQMKNWNLILAVTPRAGVNTVDNFMRVLEPNKHPRKHFWFRGNKIPPGYLAVKFARNPYARAVSQFICWAGQNEETSKKTFVEFLNHCKITNMHTCDPHWGFQFKKQDVRFEIFKIENFEKFLNRFNEFGGHSFKINNFAGGNIKNKIKTSEKFFNISYRQIFDLFNIDGYWLDYRKKKNPNGYYLGIEPDFNIPEYLSFYNDEIKNMVENIFNWDIVNLNYKFEDMIEINNPKDLK